MILLDPVFSRYASTPGSKELGPAAMSIYRRDVWPSRDEAIAGFKRSKFYQGWDPRVLERWVNYGIRDAPGGKGEVILTTSKHQEVFTYLRPSWDAYDKTGKILLHPDLVPDLDPSLNEKYSTFPVYRPEAPATLDNLPKLRPSALYIFGSKSNLSPPALRKEKMEITGIGVGGSGGAKVGRVKEVVGDYGHLIPLEAPLFCAKAAAEWVKGEVDRWWVAEREYEAWTRRSGEEKTMISEEFKGYMGRPERKDKAKI